MIILFTILALLLCDPELPVYPPQFVIPFTEIWENATSKLTWDVMYYYDAVNNKGRNDNKQGQSDNTCLSVLPDSHEECRLIQNGEWRYVYWPTLNKCCKCCNVSSGCGILKQDWIVDGEYVGVESFGKVQCQGWLKYGWAANYYYLKPAKPYGIPCAIVMNYTDFGYCQTYLFDEDKYQEGYIDQSIFDVPAGCDSKCSGSLCNS